MGSGQGLTFILGNGPYRVLQQLKYFPVGPFWPAHILMCFLPVSLLLPTCDSSTSGACGSNLFRRMRTCGLVISNNLQHLRNYLSLGTRLSFLFRGSLRHGNEN